MTPNGEHQKTSPFLASRQNFDAASSVSKPLIRGRDCFHEPMCFGPSFSLTDPSSLWSVPSPCYVCHVTGPRPFALQTQQGPRGIDIRDAGDAGAASAGSPRPLAAALLLPAAPPRLGALPRPPPRARVAPVPGGPAPPARGGVPPVPGGLAPPGGTAGGLGLRGVPSSPALRGVPSSPARRTPRPPPRGSPARARPGLPGVRGRGTQVRGDQAPPSVPRTRPEGPRHATGGG